MVELELPTGEIVRGFKDMNANVVTEDGFVYSPDGRVLSKPSPALGAPIPDIHQNAGSGGVSFTPGVASIDADKVRPQPISWLWRGWLARGKVHILAGAPSAGKTSAALALAAIITRAGRWPDGSAAKLGSVAVWSGEDGIKDVLVPRLLAADADPSRVKLISSYTDYGGSRAFDPATDMQELSAAFALSDDPPVLLVVDPIVSAVSGDSNQSAQVRRSLQPLVDLAEIHNCAVLGISHFSKGTAGRDPTERVTGSLAFGALASVVLAAAKLPDDHGGGRLLVKAKSNLGPDIGGFRYDLDALVLPKHPGVEATREVWGPYMVG